MRVLDSRVGGDREVRLVVDVGRLVKGELNVRYGRTCMVSRDVRQHTCK